MARPARAARALSVALGASLVLAACGNDVGAPARTVQPSADLGARTVQPTAELRPPTPFPVTRFAAISASPEPSSVAARLQSVLDGMAVAGGMTATVMSSDGTWSGASGTADGVHALTATSQFGIASITKSIVAAQVMQLVEAGEISLDAPAVRYLGNLRFDANGATIRQLLSHRSGLPDWYSEAMEREMARDRSRVWTREDVLALVPVQRGEPGGAFEYADTNYLLLGLVIEGVRHRPLVDVLRAGVLRVPGTERLVYQPDEAPTAPMAMPLGEPASAFETGAGFLPSRSDASSAGPAGAIASDSIALARWWRAFCAGEVVSPDSLTEMSRFYDGSDGYGLGLFNVADPWAAGIGHAGSNFGYVSSAACLTNLGVVVTVLANFPADDISGMGRPLVEALGGPLG